MSDSYDQAKIQVESVVAMVAALSVDYDRLEELKEERAELLLKGSATDLDEWEAENADELAELEKEAGDCESVEDAQQSIQEDALSVEVRSGWESTGSELTACEYRIVLCTGGPHVEIRGDLDEYNNPLDARVRYSDMDDRGWLVCSRDEVAALVAYASVFSFGE